MDCDPSALLEAAKCFCFDSGRLQQVKTYLLCQIVGNAPPIGSDHRIINTGEIRSINGGDLRIYA